MKVSAKKTVKTKRKKLTKEQRVLAKDANDRYEESMKKLKMKRVPVWCHVDDIEHIRAHALKRAKKLSLLD